MAAFLPFNCPFERTFYRLHQGGPMGLQCDPLGLYENMSEDMRKVRPHALTPS